MVEFKGELSEDVKQKAFLYQQRKVAKALLIAGIVAGIIAIGYAFLCGFNLNYLMQDGAFLTIIILFLVLLTGSVVYYFKPVSKTLMQKKYDFSILFDGSKVVYNPTTQSYGKREFSTAMINKFVEFDNFYYLITEGRREPYICEKKLLVQGDLEEFNAILKNAKFKKIETPSTTSNKSSSASNEQPESGEVEQTTANLTGAEKVESTLATTRFGRKIRQRLPREKEYRWAVASIVCSILAVVLVQPFLTVGFSVIDVLLPEIATFFFSHVVELFTAVFALVGTVVSSFAVILGIILLMPIGGILCLIFAIVQLTRNRRWWSWLSLAVSLASIVAIFVQIATFN